MRQHLVAPAGEGHHVLLQRPDAEGAADRIVGELAVRAVGAHHELAVALEEGGFDGEVPELHVVEVAQHRGGVRLLHGLLVVRALPGLELALVAALAGGRADEIRRRLSGQGRLRRDGLNVGDAGGGRGRACRGKEEVKAELRQPGRRPPDRLPASVDPPGEAPAPEGTSLARLTVEGAAAPADLRDGSLRAHGCVRCLCIGLGTAFSGFFRVSKDCDTDVVGAVQQQSCSHGGW